MAATAHLPANQPKAENELPQGVKNWDKPPQQVPGPEGPEPHPTPEEAGAGETNSKRKPQQVNGPKGPDLAVEVPERHRFQDSQRPQQVDGPEGPAPTDGTELVKAVNPKKPAKTPAKESKTHE